MLELTFKQLYESEFEKEEHNLFPLKNIPLDWIIWYDSYNQKYRDALYSYGYKIHTANYLKDPKCKNHKGLIKFCRASNQDLLEPEPTYLHKVFSKYTRYDNKFARSSSVPCNNLMVRKNFEKDLYYIGPGEKYTYWNVFPEEDKQSRFSYYLSTIGNSNLEFENMYYEIDYDLGENLHYNTNEGLRNKNSDQNMASDSKNVTEENFIQNSRNKVRKCSTEEYFDVRTDVHENSSTGPLSCVSGTANPTYDTAFAAETQCRDMVRTKMTKTNSYFCPFCNLFPVEYVHDLNIFPFLHVCSICVIRKNIYFKRMFRELRHPVNRKHDIGSLRIEFAKCEIPTDVSHRTRKYTFVNGRPGFNKKFISKSFRRDRAEQNYEYAFATGPEITYAPSNDIF